MDVWDNAKSDPDALQNRGAWADPMAAAGQHGLKPWPFCSQAVMATSAHTREGPPLEEKKFKLCIAELRKDGKLLLRARL